MLHFHMQQKSSLGFYTILKLPEKYTKQLLNSLLSKS
jgi:hypothetical protein